MYTKIQFKLLHTICKKENKIKNLLIDLFQGTKCLCGDTNLFKDEYESFVMQKGCQSCEVRDEKCGSKKCQQFSPFTCGNSNEGLMSVYCNPDEDNCLSFNPPAELDLKSSKHRANFSYFGCVKKPDDTDEPEMLENRSSKKTFGIQCLEFCAQQNKIMALMRLGFKGMKIESMMNKIKYFPF